MNKISSINTNKIKYVKKREGKKVKRWAAAPPAVAISPPSPAAGWDTSPHPREGQGDRTHVEGLPFLKGEALYRTEITIHLME